jgi:hypothetical protein
MDLRELKKSTIYQSSDLDDMTVMIAVSRNGKRQLEPLCFLGFSISPEPGIVVVGGLTELQRMVENGETSKPDDYIPPEELPKYFFEF